MSVARRNPREDWIYFFTSSSVLGWILVLVPPGENPSVFPFSSIQARTWPNSPNVSGRKASATLWIIFRTFSDPCRSERELKICRYISSSFDGAFSRKVSKSGPELKHARFSTANDAQRKVPSDFIKRASFASIFRPTSHPNPSTLFPIKFFTSSLTRLFVSRLILSHPVRLPGRVFETWGTSRLERNILTLWVSMSPRIFLITSVHKLSFSPSMPSIRMYTGSVLQSRITFPRTFHEEYGLVKSLSPWYLSSALQLSKRFSSCCRIPYSMSLAILASLRCGNSASSADMLSVGNSGETKWKPNLAPGGESRAPSRNSATTRLANIVFPVPGLPQTQSNLDPLPSRHSLYLSSAKIHSPVPASG